MSRKGIITFEHKGDFTPLTRFMNTVSKGDYILNVLKKYGQEGVDALKAATPVRTGKTAASWYYTIEAEGNRLSICWNNSNLAEGWVPVALLIYTGHGTRSGAYIPGRDYINPAIQPIFDKIAKEVWKEVADA